MHVAMLDMTPIGVVGNSAQSYFAVHMDFRVRGETGSLREPVRLVRT